MQTESLAILENGFLAWVRGLSLLSTAIGWNSTILGVRQQVVGTFFFVLPFISLADSSWEAIPGSSLPGCVVGNIVVGILLGSVPFFLIAGLRTGMRTVEDMLGFDPSAMASDDFSRESAVSRLVTWGALALFIASGCHLRLVQALLDSFIAVPVGGDFLAIANLRMFIVILEQSFQIGVSLISPLGVVALLTFLSMMTIARILPALNSSVVGVNLQIVMMLMGMLLLFGGLAQWGTRISDSYAPSVFEHLIIVGRDTFSAAMDTAPMQQ